MIILLFVVVLAVMLVTLSLFGGRRQGSGRAQTVAGTGDKPNFVVFLIDDLDVRTMQVMLEGNLLPQIRSKIVEGAVEFENAIVTSSICSPSRASMLTGRYAHNHGVWHVLGNEGPQQFDAYLNNSGDAYLPTWLGADYYRAFVGKFHLGADHPNWDYFAEVDGYDLRPGNYVARENGQTVVPPVYQTRYIGDTARKAIRFSGGKPLFLLVAPTAIHVNVTNWRQMGTLPESTFGGKPVSFAQFKDPQTGQWRQHVVAVGTSGGSLVHTWWERNSASRDTGWASWTRTGDDNTIAANTGTGNVAGWNILCPSTPVKRQQLVRTTRQDIAFWSRDITSGQPVPAWVKTADASFLAGTGVLPVVGWAAIEMPSGLIRQQVLRGDDFYGYKSWVKYRLPNGQTTPWREDADWGESVVFGRVTGFNLIPTSGARFIAQVTFQRPGADRCEWWQSPEMTDFQELALSGSATGLSQPAAGQQLDEGEQYLSPTMKYEGQSYDVAPAPGDSRRDPGEPAKEVNEVHPYYVMRAYPEGGWSPILPDQVYNWGATYPAGNLRQNRDINGFDALMSSYELPQDKTSFNRQLDNTLDFYSIETWPDLEQTVWAARRQEDYLRRLHLDRMEQMMSVDRMVGEVVDLLGANTVIIFTSDNGHYTGEHRLSNKLAPHDESIRMPLYIKAPGTQKRTVNRLVGNIDIAPTLLEYAGKAWYAGIYNVDGRSLKGLVDRPSVTSWRRSLLVEFHRPRASNIPTEGTDWRFGLPDYLALRVAPDTGTFTADSLYVQYYRTLSDLDSANSFERYFMAVDPNQTNNEVTGILPALDRMLRDFYVSAGRDARIMDIKRVP
jgi:arylsulfatase A-like enzyme